MSRNHYRDGSDRFILVRAPKPAPVAGGNPSCQAYVPPQANVGRANHNDLGACFYGAYPHHAA